MLQASHYWMADVTFKNTPSLFAQVYVVHGLLVKPLISQNQTPSTKHIRAAAEQDRAIYRRMCEQIRILCPAVQSVHMLLDFEKAAINSLRMSVLMHW